MKMNLKVFKKGKPVYWIIGAVFLFIVFYLLMNPGDKSTGGSTQVVTTGPSEALQAAALQTGASVSMAQMSANIEARRIDSEIAGQQLGASVALANLASGERVALFQLGRQADLAALAAETNFQMNRDNLAFNLNQQQVNSATQVALRQMDIGLLNKQMDTQAWMFAKQSDNLIAQSLIGQISNLKKGDRDNALISLAIGAPSSRGSITGPAVSPGLLTGGGFNAAGNGAYNPSSNGNVY